MSKLPILSFVMFVAILFPSTDNVWGQVDSDDYEINHIKTIKQKHGGNYYSYNFAVHPGESTIDRIKIAIISDIETKYAETERDISSPHLISFGIMIHATDPDKIRYEVVEIITK